MNWLENLISRIKCIKEDIYIYGAGFLAQKYSELLENNDISFSGYIVDQNYLPREEKERFINGKPIFTIDDIKNDIVVIIGVRASFDGTVFPRSKHIKEYIAADFSTYRVFGAFDSDFLIEHNKELVRLYKELADNTSRFALAQFITQKITGTYSKQFSYEKQYFDSTVYTPSKNEVMVDCGAYTGDSIVEFDDFLKKHGIDSFEKIYALEPDKDNYNKLCESTETLKNVVPYMLGAYDRKDVLHFCDGEGEHSSIDESGSISIEVDTIDNIVKDNRVTFIKMDIEGSELKALQGARNTILRNKPRLAVCIYHRETDIIDIPGYISSLVPEYKFYIRNYDPTGVETVLYAVIE